MPSILRSLDKFVNKGARSGRMLAQDFLQPLKEKTGRTIEHEALPGYKFDVPEGLPIEPFRQPEPQISMKRWLIPGFTAGAVLGAPEEAEGSPIRAGTRAAVALERFLGKSPSKVVTSKEMKDLYKEIGKIHQRGGDAWYLQGDIQQGVRQQILKPLEKEGLLGRISATEYLLAKDAETFKKEIQKLPPIKLRRANKANIEEQVFGGKIDLKAEDVEITLYQRPLHRRVLQKDVDKAVRQTLERKKRYDALLLNPEAHVPFVKSNPGILHFNENVDGDEIVQLVGPRSQKMIDLLGLPIHSWEAEHHYSKLLFNNVSDTFSSKFGIRRLTDERHRWDVPGFKLTDFQSVLDDIIHPSEYPTINPEMVRRMTEGITDAITQRMVQPGFNPDHLYMPIERYADVFREEFPDLVRRYQLDFRNFDFSIGRPDRNVPFEVVRQIDRAAAKADIFMYRLIRVLKEQAIIPPTRTEFNWPRSAIERLIPDMEAHIAQAVQIKDEAAARAFSKLDLLDRPSSLVNVGKDKTTHWRGEWSNNVEGSLPGEYTLREAGRRIFLKVTTHPSEFKELEGLKRSLLAGHRGPMSFDTIPTTGWLKILDDPINNAWLIEEIQSDILGNVRKEMDQIKNTYHFEKRGHVLKLISGDPLLRVNREFVIPERLRKAKGWKELTEDFDSFNWNMIKDNDIKAFLGEQVFSQDPKIATLLQHEKKLRHWADYGLGEVLRKAKESGISKVHIMSPNAVMNLWRGHLGRSKAIQFYRDLPKRFGFELEEPDVTELKERVKRYMTKVERLFDSTKNVDNLLSEVDDWSKKELLDWAGKVGWDKLDVASSYKYLGKKPVETSWKIPALVFTALGASQLEAEEAEAAGPPKVSKTIKSFLKGGTSSAEERLVGQEFNGKVIKGVTKGSRNNRYVHFEDNTTLRIDKEYLHQLVGHVMGKPYYKEALRTPGQTLPMAQKSLQMRSWQSKYSAEELEAMYSRGNSLLQELGVGKQELEDLVLVKMAEGDHRVLWRPYAEALKESGEVSSIIKALKGK